MRRARKGLIFQCSASLVALSIGLAISAIGLLLVHVGGYGPCGPAGPMAEVGAFLTVLHVELLCAALPQLEDMVLRHRNVWLNCFILLLIPAINWFLVVFVLLKIGSRFRSSSPECISSPDIDEEGHDT